MIQEAITKLDSALETLLRVIESNYAAAVKNHTEVIAHMLLYYKTFNDLFQFVSLEEKQALYEHFLLQHAKLGRSADHVAKGFGVEMEQVPSFLEESSAHTPTDSLLRERLKKELDRLGAALRLFKRGQTSKKRRAPSPYRTKI
jgi:hypothetical protein